MTWAMRYWDITHINVILSSSQAQTGKALGNIQFLHFLTFLFRKIDTNYRLDPFKSKFIIF